MFITICRKSEVYKVCEDQNITHIISTLDPGDRITAPSYITDHLLLTFDDIEEPNEKYSPKLEDVAEILEWSRKLKDEDRVLIHCWAGVSRSTALALAVWIQHHGKDYEAARKWLVETRPIACPNRLIAEYADMILGCDGELYKVAEEIGDFRLLGNLVPKKAV